MNFLIMRKTNTKILYISLILMSFTCFAQSENQDINTDNLRSRIDTIYNQANNLYKTYHFQEAKRLYTDIKSITKDTIFLIKVDKKIIDCYNGINMLKYSITPKVKAKKTVSLKNFFLNFNDFGSNAWIPTPNPFSNTHDKYYQGTFFPDDANTVYYSAPDSAGHMKIYSVSRINEEHWSTPKLINENNPSYGNDIYPMLSNDGKSLYFASDGYYGIGGYDLYVSHWDNELQEWGVPQNMGFPFSSTSNDIFFADSPDGQSSIIVSDRDIADTNKVNIFITNYDPEPIKKAIEDEKEITQIASLEPPIAVKKEKVKGNDAAAGESSEFTRAVATMRMLQRQIDTLLEAQKRNRDRYETTTNEDDKAFLKRSLAESEKETIAMRTKLNAATANVRKIEMEFLQKGIIVRANEEEETKPKEVYVPEYIFKKSDFRSIPSIIIEKPIPKFDYTFRKESVAQYAEDMTLPNGLVYQIQLFVLTRRPRISQLNGFCPIFEKIYPSGKRLYAAGLFYKYSEALSALRIIRKSGFPSAFTIAYNDGKSISLKTAKALEAKGVSSNKPFQILIHNIPDGLSSDVMKIIRENTDKDIAKIKKTEGIVYVIGPFSREADAKKLQDILINIGLKNVSLEEIK